MKLSVLALALTIGALWGLSMGGVALLAVIMPGYASGFLSLMASIYPGISELGTWLNVAVCAGYGLVDGLLFGALIGWVYNFMADKVAGR